MDSAKIDIQEVFTIAKDLEDELSLVLKKHYERMSYKEWDVQFSISDYGSRIVAKPKLNPHCIILNNNQAED